MQESEGTKHKTADGETPEEATSSKTLSEIEETEKVPSGGEGGKSTDTPSPDGAFDEGRAEGDVRDDAGPV